MTESTATNGRDILTTLANSINETYICRSAYTERFYLDSTQIYILVATWSLTMVLVWVMNSAVIYAMVTLKLNNPSMTLILYLSFSDLGMGVLAMPLFLTLIISSYNCNLDCATEFFVAGFGRSSSCITGIIGYDRYFRMKYLNGYSTVVKRWKVCVATAVAFVLSLLHSSAHVVGIQYNVYYVKIASLGTVVDCIIMVFMIVPYALTVRSVKVHRRNTVNRELLSEVDRTVTTIALRIVIAIITLYMPFLIIATMRRFLPADSMVRTQPIYHFMLFVSYNFIAANSFVNAAIFISMNSACRRKIFNCTRDVDGATNSYRFKRGNERLINGKSVSPV